MRRPKNFLALLDFALNRACQAKIADLRLSIEVEQDIRGLNVAVNDAVFMGVSQAVANVGDQTNHLVLVDRLAVGRVKNRLAGNELHDDEKHSIHLTEIIDPNQIWVVETGHRFGLSRKAFTKSHILTQFQGKNF